MFSVGKRPFPVHGNSCDLPDVLTDNKRECSSSFPGSGSSRSVMQERNRKMLSSLKPRSAWRLCDGPSSFLSIPGKMKPPQPSELTGRN